MKKGLWIILLLFAFFPLIAMEAFLLPSLAVNVEDQEKNIPPSRSVHLPSVSEISAGQNVTLFLVFKDPQSAEREVVGTLTSTDPAGNKKVIAENICFLKGKTPGCGVLFSGMRITLKMDPSDPVGEYRFALLLQDRKSGEICRTECRLKLLPEDVAFPPMENAEWNTFLPTYYKDPRPRRLPAALDYFFDHEMEMRKRAGKQYDPRPILYGLARAFELNPQLWSFLAMRWVELDSKEKRFMFALLVSSMGDEAVRTISEKIGGNEGEILRNVHAKKLFLIEPLHAPWQLDCLWMDFLVTGRYRPIEILCGELRKRELMTAADVKRKTEKGETLTPEEKKKFVNFLMTAGTELTLITKIRQGDLLIAYYMESMLLKKSYPDETAGARIVTVLRQASQKETKKKQPSPAEPAGEKKK